MIYIKSQFSFSRHRLIPIGLMVFLITPFTQTAYGAQTFKLNASDAANSDHFGSSVAVNGGKALVGAFQAEDAVWQAGSAYLFDVNTGQELLKLTASDPASEAFFGSSVALNGDLALVGAFQDDDAGWLSGSAYLFDATTGQELFKLTASDAEASDHFGASAALSGNLAVVGADWDDDNGGHSGSAYLFDTTTGGQLAKLTAPDAAGGDSFGLSVALDGNIVLIGARNSGNMGNGAGAAYVFDVSNPLAPVMLHKLTASDGAISDAFGVSVSLSGNLALIGSFADDDAGSISGSAYLFDVITGQELAKFAPDDAAADQWFGYSVSLSGDKALVGAHSDSEMGSNAGAAYVFDVSNPLAPVQLEKLTASDAGNFRIFGLEVALSGNTAVVGTYNGSNAAGITTGAAYLFTVPEPHSFLLAAWACAVGVFGRRRKCPICW